MFLILLFPIFTFIVEAEANHREDNEVLIFLSSPQNLLCNFLSLYVFFKEEPKITQASTPGNLDELQGEQISCSEDPRTGLTGRHNRELGEVGMSGKPMT